MIDQILPELNLNLQLQIERTHRASDETRLLRKDTYIS